MAKEVKATIKLKNDGYLLFNPKLKNGEYITAILTLSEEPSFLGHIESARTADIFTNIYQPKDYPVYLMPGSYEIIKFHEEDWVMANSNDEKEPDLFTMNILEAIKYNETKPVRLKGSNTIYWPMQLAGKDEFTDTQVKSEYEVLCDSISIELNEFKEIFDKVASAKLSINDRYKILDELIKELGI